MPNRKRLFTDVANTFLLWAEEVPSEPPWIGHVLRRPWKLTFETPDGPVEHTTPPWQDRFVARTETIAKEAAVITVRNCFAEYAHRLESLIWIESQVSDEEWEGACHRFIGGKNFELR